MSKSSFLLIGPFPDKEFRHIGGTSVLFRNFIDFIQSRSLNHSYITTTKYGGFGNGILNFLNVVFHSLFSIPRHDIVIFNFNKRSIIYLAPFLFWYAKILHTKIAIRMFGASTSQVLESVNTFLRWILTKILANADLLFFETRIEVSYFKKINENTYLFPNCRNYSLKFRPRKYNRKFVFLSQIKIEKGILLILEAFRDLNDDYSIEIYGPILDPALDYIKGLSCYKGIVDFNEVYKVLDHYDVLVLPTFQNGEGYPGIIIEAYSMSMPVITTRWNSIPEIVEDGVSGYLIEPYSVHALKESILKINDENYDTMNCGAFEKSKDFQSVKVHEQILLKMQEVTKLNFE